MAGAFGDLAGVQPLATQEQDAGAVGNPTFGFSGPQTGLKDFNVLGGKDNSGGFGTPEHGFLPLRSIVPGF